MQNPFKTGEFIPSTPKKGSGCVLFLFIVGGLGYLAYAGITGFMARL